MNKGRKIGNHSFGLRKEGRKLPPLTHTFNAPKRGEKSKERREMKRERRKCERVRREMRKRKEKLKG